MRSNPLASHGGLTIKADAGHSTSRRLILEASSEVGMICLDGDKGHFNLMHLGASLDVETCPMAEELLQGVMNRGHIEVYSAKRGERDVCMQSYDKNPSKPKPLVIHFTRDVTTQRPRGFQPVIVKKPAPFPYKSDKTVPWKYTAQGPDGRKDAFLIHVKDNLPSAKVKNISNMSGMTRSGRIFATPELPVRSKDKGKA